MAARATIRDVARAVKVSETTVSLAFRENSRISAKTRARVLQAARELSYTPNLVARNLRNGKTSTLAVIVNDIANPFYGVMLREAEQAALERGYCTVFGSSNWNPEKERTLIMQMLQMRVPGIIICFSERSAENYALIRDAGVPCVAVDSYPQWYDGPYVANDFKAAAHVAAAHLAEIGCRSPILLTAAAGQRDFSAFGKIEQHFADKLNRLGISFGPDCIVAAGLDIAAGRSAMRRVLEKGSEVDGVFCVNDLCAAGAMEAIIEAGLRPGKDVAVIGIDDMEISSFAGLSLTSLHQPYEVIARRATNAIADVVEGEGDLAVRAELPPQLRIRGTTRLHQQPEGRRGEASPA